MPNVTSTDRVTYWSAGNPVEAAGILDMPGTVLSGLEIYFSEDVNEFLGALRGHASGYNPLPDLGLVSAGDLYGYDGDIVIVWQSHSRTGEDPRTLPELFRYYDPDPIADISLNGSESVNADFMPSNMRPWYDSLKSMLLSTMYPDPISAAASGDLYLMARTVAQHVVAIMLAFRVTGDYDLLDHIDTIMDVARGTLADYDGDGLLEWVYSESSNVPEVLWGTDNGMDKNMADAVVACFCYALYVNRSHSETYNNHYQFWSDYLQNHANKHLQWIKTLAHCHAAGMLWFNYLYKLLGGQNNFLSLDKDAQIFGRAMIKRGEAFVWEHRMLEIYNLPYACQQTGYSQYTVEMLSDLACNGVWPFTNRQYMRHFYRSAVDWVLRGGIIRGDVCGNCNRDEEPTRSGGDTVYTPQRWASWGWQSVAAWGDNGGVMDDLAHDAFNMFPVCVYMPALMTFALGYRYWATNGCAPWKNRPEGSRTQELAR